MAFRWRDYKTALIEEYGKGVYRIAVDGGFGCPNRDHNLLGGCLYCDERGSFAPYQRDNEAKYAFEKTLKEDGIEKVARPSTLIERKEALKNQIERGFKFIDTRYPNNYKSLYFQAYTSTYDKAENLKELYHFALKQGLFKELIVSTRCDALNEEVIEVLLSCKEFVDTIWLEVGLQSGNDKTLTYINRGHDVKCFLEACEKLHKNGLRVGSHIILGLPFEKEAEVLKTAAILREAKVEAVKIHALHIVSGTPFHKLYNEGAFKLLTATEYLQHTLLFLRNIDKDVIIQRLATDTNVHRLVAPLDYPVKNKFRSLLQEEMVKLNAWQGDML